MQFKVSGHEWFSLIELWCYIQYVHLEQRVIYMQSNRRGQVALSQSNQQVVNVNIGSGRAAVELHTLSWLLLRFPSFFSILHILCWLYITSLLC